MIIILTLEHSKLYDLGATMARYDAHSDTFVGGNYFVARSQTVFKDAVGATLKWYKLERDGDPVKVWQDGIPPTIWGKLDYRLYEYMPELEAGRYNWVQISGKL